MKHLMTLLALVVAVTAGAQGTTIHEYPWNPDWDNDNFVGSSDLTGFLSAFGSEFGNPPEPCDYDGSDFEQLMFGILDGSVVLDSMFVEYQLLDSSTFYVTGCPDPITETTLFTNTALIYPQTLYSDEMYIVGDDSYGNNFNWFFGGPDGNGNYFVGLYSQSLATLGFHSDGFFGGYSASTTAIPIPFESAWQLTENGIELSGWDEEDWPYYANYLHILPYWHYAE